MLSQKQIQIAVQKAKLLDEKANSETNALAQSTIPSYDLDIFESANGEKQYRQRITKHVQLLRRRIQDCEEAMEKKFKRANTETETKLLNMMEDLAGKKRKRTQKKHHAQIWRYCLNAETEICLSADVAEKKAMLQSVKSFVDQKEHESTTLSFKERNIINKV